MIDQNTFNDEVFVEYNEEHQESNYLTNDMDERSHNPQCLKTPKVYRRGLPL